MPSSFNLLLCGSSEWSIMFVKLLCDSIREVFSEFLGHTFVVENPMTNVCMVARRFTVCVLECPRCIEN